jgi:hypothetical protein
MALKPRSGFSRQNFLAKTLAAPFRRLGRFPFPITREARSFNPKVTLLRCDNAKDAAKIFARPCDYDGDHY